MPENGLFDLSLPTLTIYDRADRPARSLLAHAGQIIELGGAGATCGPRGSTRRFA